MPTGFPYAGILFLLLLFNALFYFLRGLWRWKERVRILPYLFGSDLILSVFFVAGVLWEVVRGSSPWSILVTVPLWVLGVFVVNTLAGLATFALIRGAAKLLEDNLRVTEIQPAEGPSSTWQPGDSVEAAPDQASEPAVPAAAGSGTPPSTTP